MSQQRLAATGQQAVITAQLQQQGRHDRTDTFIHIYIKSNQWQVGAASMTVPDLAFSTLVQFQVYDLRDPSCSLLPVKHHLLFQSSAAARPGWTSPCGLVIVHTISARPRGFLYIQGDELYLLTSRCLVSLFNHVTSKSSTCGLLCRSSPSADGLPSNLLLLLCRWFGSLRTRDIR